LSLWILWAVACVAAIFLDYLISRKPRLEWCRLRYSEVLLKQRSRMHTILFLSMSLMHGVMPTPQIATKHARTDPVWLTPYFRSEKLRRSYKPTQSSLLQRMLHCRPEATKQVRDTLLVIGIGETDLRAPRNFPGFNSYKRRREWRFSQARICGVLLFGHAVEPVVRCCSIRPPTKRHSHARFEKGGLIT
jgi:hypothetical protein